jgi:four helix bundle protein
MYDVSKKFRFRKFRVYIEARLLIRALRAVAVKFPDTERFDLSSQLRRAASSVVLNIAEGSERRSDRDFAQFLAISLASLNEVVACLDIALDEGYVGADEHASLLERAGLLGNQLSAFRRAIVNPHAGVKGQKSNVKGARCCR